MTTCPRCGAELPSLAAISLVLRDDAGRAAEAYQSLLTMRLAMPDAVPSTLRALASRWAVLAASLACHAGLCAPRDPATAATVNETAPVHRDGRPDDARAPALEQFRPASTPTEERSTP